MHKESGTDRYVYNHEANNHEANPTMQSYNHQANNHEANNHEANPQDVASRVKGGAHGWSKTLAQAAKASGAREFETSPFNEKMPKMPSRVAGGVHAKLHALHAKLHARMQSTAKDVHSDTGTAENDAAMRGPGGGGGKLDEWPAGEWHSFSGIDETGEDYPAKHHLEDASVVKPHKDWPDIKWHSTGAKDVTKPSNYRAPMARTYKLGGGEKAETAQVSDDEKAEWFFNWTKDYNPGSLGSPGMHEGQAYPAEYPKQEDDGSWQPDPGTGLGPKACIYMYAGPECGRGAIEGANYGLAAAVEDMPPIGSQQIKKIYSLHPSAVRGILWDDDENNPLGETMYFVIPALHDYPRVPHNSKIDIREYVYTGHTVLMMGGVINIYLMNELFGWNMLPQYQPGPYLWNDRSAPGTPFEHVTRKVYEQGNSRMGMTGVAIGSIPRGGLSYFDNNGASVALCVPLGRGRACYVDQEWIRPMTPYGCGVWAQIVQAALNGGRCKCLCQGPMIHPPNRSCLCAARDTTQMAPLPLPKCPSALIKRFSVKG